MFAQDKVAAIEHETESIRVISKALRNTSISSDSDSPNKEAITWAMSRLAMTRSQQGDRDTALRHLNTCALTCGSMEVMASYKFASHVQCTHSVLLLMDFERIKSINPQLQRTYGDIQRSALAEVEAQGFRLTLASLLSLRSLKMDPQLLDILCALMALCNPVGLSSTQPDAAFRNQTVELLKLGVRLTELTSSHFATPGTEGSPDWKVQMQACVRLTSFLFVLCPSPAAQATCDEVRQRLTMDVLEHITALKDTSDTVSVLSLLLLWILLVCGSSAPERPGKVHFFALIKKYFPNVVSASDTAVEEWKLSMPLLGVGSESPADYFWRLSTTDTKTTSTEAPCRIVELPPSPNVQQVPIETVETCPMFFSTEDEFLTF